MDFSNKPVLILGGFGLVGQAIARSFLARPRDERPSKVIIHSLRKAEAEAAVNDLLPQAGSAALLAEWGDILALREFKDCGRADLLQIPEARRRVALSLLTPLLEHGYEEFFLHDLITRHEPAVIVDAVNTATAIAYGNVYEMTDEVLNALSGSEPHSPSIEFDLLQKVLASAYLPLLIRHTQILYKSMAAAKTLAYVKIGTSGTGGMGFNIPYTHSEEKPSRELLTKSAVAGAHTMLLFLMSRTPDAPRIIKEIKPAAAIAWKKISCGRIERNGKPIRLFDVGNLGRTRVANNEVLEAVLPETEFESLGTCLENVYIDTGENGLFSLEEFSALTTADQMQFVTPEEIADLVLRELEGGSTGHDVIDALDHAVLPGSYRAGLMRHWALRRLEHLEASTGKKSVAFEHLGPPRLTKLLFEAHILRVVANESARVVLERTAEQLSADASRLIETDRCLRTEIISVGIPILFEDGQFLRGPEIKVPRQSSYSGPSGEKLRAWADSGWVDLTAANMEKWKERFRQIEREIAAIPSSDSSSQHLRHSGFWGWGADYRILPGKLAGWIFSREGGQRKAAT